MSEARAADQVVTPAVDQTSRASGALVIEEGDDVIARMRKQIQDLETERDTERQKAEEQKQQVEAERRAREYAQQRAQEAETRAATASRTAEDGRRTVEDAQLEAIATGLQAREQRMTALKSALAAAGAEGDFVKQADVQAQMSELGAEIVQLKTGKSQLEQQKTQRDQQQQQGGGRQPDDENSRREQWISQQAPAVQDWVRAHPQFFTDQQFQQRVSAASAKVIQNGMSVYHPKYIEMVEIESGLRQAPAVPAANPDQGTTVVTAPPVQPRGREADRVVAAPAGGSTIGAGAPESDQRVYLSPDEIAQARRDGVSLEDFAKAKRELIAEGRLWSHGRRQ